MRAHVEGAPGAPIFLHARRKHRREKLPEQPAGLVQVSPPFVAAEQTLHPVERGIENVKQLPMLVSDDIADHKNRVALVVVEAAGRLVASKLPEQIEAAGDILRVMFGHASEHLRQCVETVIVMRPAPRFMELEFGRRRGRERHREFCEFERSPWLEMGDVCPLLNLRPAIVE